MDFSRPSDGPTTEPDPLEQQTSTLGRQLRFPMFQKSPPVCVFFAGWAGGREATRCLDNAVRNYIVGAGHAVAALCEVSHCMNNAAKNCI